MNIFDFFHHTDPANNVLAVHGTGAQDRPEHYGKPDAPSHAEISGAIAPANWIEKDPTTGFTTYPKRNQGIKSDCTCYGAAKLLSIDYLNETGIYRELSPDMVYPFVVKPGGGASSLDVMNFVVSKGMGVDALYPSDGLTEAQAESQSGLPVDNKAIGMLYKAGGIIQCATDFETIASILQAYKAQGIKKAIGATVVGQNNGTWYSLKPTPPNGQNGLWYHRITITDFGLIQGVKVLAFDNSWGTAPGNGGQQFLTENYAGSLYGGIYTLNQSPLDSVMPPAKPSHQWSTPLTPGMSSSDVLMLQKALQSLGMFPISSVVSPTGYYGGITKAGVILFQAAFGISQTGIVDAATITQLNNIFK